MNAAKKQEQQKFLEMFDKISVVEFDFTGDSERYGYPYINYLSESEPAAKRRAARELQADIKKISCIDGEIFIDVEVENLETGVFETKKILTGEYKIIPPEDRKYLIMQD